MQRTRRLKYWAIGTCLVVVACSGEGAPASIDSGTIHGFWEVVELGGQRPLRAQSVTFTLDPELPSGSRHDPRSGHRVFSGFDGCNGFGGAYVVAANHLESPSLAGTLIGCAEDVQLQGHQFTDTLQDSEWTLADRQLTLSSDSGIVVVLRRVEPEGAIGVWTLIEIDGQPITGTISLTIWSEGRFSGYAGCWISGQYVIEGDLLTMSGTASLESATTTAPPQTNDGAVSTQESVPALFGCESASASEQAFLALAASGQISVDNNELTITGDDTTALFRRG